MSAEINCGGKTIKVTDDIYSPEGAYRRRVCGNGLQAFGTANK